MKKLQFLKLGGSLITQKNLPHTPRLEVISRLAVEIAAAKRENPSFNLVLGHGSGSFGHVPASQFATRQGVRTKEQWDGFIQVWNEAAALHRIVLQALADAGMPAISFPPSACIIADAGVVSGWDLNPLQAALQAGLLPVIYGDVVFDRKLGGTILSTEDLFAALAAPLQPERILLAGIEPGVWSDFPACTSLVAEITPQARALVAPSLMGSTAVDVTGGMGSKVTLSLELVERLPNLQVRIFSGELKGAVHTALLGAQLGTLIHRGA